MYKTSEIGLPSSPARARAHNKAIQEAKSKLEQLLSKQGEATRTGDDSGDLDLHYEVITRREALVKNLEKGRAAANVDQFSTLGSTEVRIIPSWNVPT
jgi:hypothetical protein